MRSHPAFRPFLRPSPGRCITRGASVFLFMCAVSVAMAPRAEASSWGDVSASRVVVAVRCLGGTYRSPVDLPIVDPFRLPDGPYRAGNRGLEYNTTAGVIVRTIGAGVVTFAGPVAGSWFVTVRHPDGLRSSYSFLATVSVGADDLVAPGEQLGSTSERRFHLGVREGDRYIDPFPLLGTRGRAWLIPLGRFGDGSGCRRT